MDRSGPRMFSMVSSHDVVIDRCQGVQSILLEPQRSKMEHLYRSFQGNCALIYSTLAESMLNEDASISHVSYLPLFQSRRKKSFVINPGLCDVQFTHSYIGFPYSMYCVMMYDSTYIYFVKCIYCYFAKFS